MLKRTVIFAFVILWIFTLFGCTNPASTQQAEDSRNLSASDVVRYPMLGNDTQTDFSAYYASDLEYPSQQRVVDTEQAGTAKKFVVGKKEYEATYTKSRVYEDGENLFLKLGNYDEYDVTGKAEFHVFKDTGFLKFLYIFEDERKVADKIVTDFSEAGLRSVADTVLQSLYGQTINKYLNSYYQFEYGKLFEYANSEQNRYVVSYRAYLNGYPTDDIIYVQFSLQGALLGVSAQRYLQYYDVDVTTLIAVDKIEKVIRESVSKLDYTNISLYERENDVACYYTMNAKGELYYAMKWNAFKFHNEDAGTSLVEIMAVKAS